MSLKAMASYLDQVEYGLEHQDRNLSLKLAAEQLPHGCLIAPNGWVVARHRPSLSPNADLPVQVLDN